MDRPIPTAPARAYAIKAREDKDAPEVVPGIFSLYDIEMHALIDHGSTHSYDRTRPGYPSRVPRVVPPSGVPLYNP